MDKKKKIIMKVLSLLCAFIISGLSLSAQDVPTIKFGGRDYNRAPNCDSITLFINLVDDYGQKIEVQPQELWDHLHVFEDNSEVEPLDIQSLRGRLRIPKEYTFSVLVDLGIDYEGKIQIFDAIKNLVNSVPDGSVYLSFFGNGIDESQLVTRKDYGEKRALFERDGNQKRLYSAIRAKLMEFDAKLIKTDSYDFNPALSQRAKENPDKVIFFIFVDGSESPDNNDTVDYLDLVQNTDGINKKVWPKTFAFYYTRTGQLDEDAEDTFKGITGASKKLELPFDKKGQYIPTGNMDDILANFSAIVKDQMYDYAFIYKAQKSYHGKVNYVAKWDREKVGEADFSIGSPESPWPVLEDSTTDTFLKYLIAFLVAFLTIVFFFCVMKIIIPAIKSKNFRIKYYKSYTPEDGIQKKVCYYCKKPLVPGEKVVTKCKHVMHIECWKQNDYRCSEYGQNCNTGIQEHVEWRNLLSWHTIRDCQQTITGILAGFVSWIVYELLGRTSFTSMARGIADVFLTGDERRNHLLDDCTSKVGSFLTIGLLLGFFLSFIFRYNDEYRKKNGKIYLKIFGLSLLTSLIGFLAFAFGGIILCMIVSGSDTNFIPWYCSLPAYLLFSICTSLALTIKSSIPVKSAMIGGLCSAVIGFLVLYFSSIFSSRYPWMTMLLDFIIYGGGLGASLVTVRMLAEKYFLVITNGVKAGVRIPIHKWMNATGGGNKVAIGMTGECEIQMNWEKSNKVAKQHAVIYIDQARTLPVIKPMATGVIYNSRAELPVNRQAILSNGDTFKIGDTIFRYEETD